MTSDRYDELLAQYRDGLEVPGPEVDRAVMAVVRDRQRARSAAWWRWFVRPHAMEVRPLLAAAALAVVVGATALGTALAVRWGESGTVVTPSGMVLVQFDLDAPDAGTVALAGSFNGWNDSTTQFAKNPQTGKWSITVMLPPGEHEYLFVIDGERWIPDPDAHALVDDGFGNQNSMIVVGPRGVVRS